MKCSKMTRLGGYWSLVGLLVILCGASLLLPFALGFHLSFGQRLTKSNPQLNPASSLIRPIECRNVNNHSEAGICMFAIDCMQNKGTPLSVCKHNYFVGTCCKLPDYNNFVGIVYDLRDTETGLLLEARKSPSANLPQLATSSPPVVAASDQLANLKLSEAENTKQKLENRYIISSTSLFPTASSQAVQVEQQAASSPSSIVVGESARNVDGLLQTQSLTSLDSAPSTPKNQQQSPVSSEQLESFQIHNQPGLPMNESKASAYEIIGSVEQPAANKAPAPLLTTVNDQQFNLASTPAESQPSGEQPVKLSQNNVYLVSGDEAIGNKPNIVFANNHQLLSTSSHRPPPPQLQHSTVTASLPSSMAAAGDQEFTLSSSQTTSSTTTTTTTTAPRTTLTTTTTTTSTTPSPPTTRQAAKETATIGNNQQPASSPLVDLVSSSVSSSLHTVETTTPFTSSLSTALLPNVSSHPYAPTEPPQVAASLVPAQTFSSSSTSSSSSPSSGATASRSPPTQQVQSSKPASESFSQLYSNQHSSTQSAFQHQHHHQQNSDLNEHSAYTSRPGAGMLYPATKIVAASTGANANQLIPSLSGLQSAILSHIPFKIASGLSSGLSSYLQAAMKPSQASGGRPLLSSNTAPALQYQQFLGNNTSNKPSTSSQPSSTTTTSGLLISAVRFPGGGSTGPPMGESLTSPAAVWQQSQQNATSASHDVVREAQLVCGRPQVTDADRQVSKKRVARIVGGNQSSFGQWPWMVSLRQWRKGLFLHKCGAALLNENWAITAAHCVENVKSSDLLLRLGEFDVSNQDEPFPFAERRVKSVVSHPNFDPKTFEYDLALLRFAEPIKFERNIVPVCVPSGNDSYVDRMATVIGWGRLYEDGPLPDVIQHVDVPIITNNECERMYKNAGYIEEIPDMFICAGISKGGRDSCEGDSGGPLTMVDHDGRSYLVGIISWGIGCALPSQPGVYTRITAFSKWINQITAF